MTYAELQSLVPAYLQNQETTFLANIPSLVQQGEARIYNTVRTPDQRFSTTGSTVASTQTFSSPLGFVESQGLYIEVLGALTPLLIKQASFIRTAYPSGTGTPLYYAVQTADGTGATIMFGPTPDDIYPYTFDYFGNPVSIVTSSVTWLGNNFPEALLYGTLLEGYVYMKGEKTLLDEFQERFDRGMEMLRRSSEVLLLQDEYRNSPVGQS